MKGAQSSTVVSKGTVGGLSVALLFSAVPLVAGTAYAQSESEQSIEEVLVTGSRVVRDGYDAPTPTTVIGAEELGVLSPVNVADLVNELPALGASSNPTTQVGQISNGGTGINSLNLRDLGEVRTLVLLDGKRVPAASLTGLVDVNFLPNALIKRIDVVTGGASAAWGSDAVAGVVNFVLDKDFTGIKGELMGGMSTFGDNENYSGSLTWGTPFSGGRGHALFSYEDNYTAGVDGYPRSWYSGAKILDNPAYSPTNGEPFYLVERNTGFVNVAPGAIVTSGPLRGLYFGPGGTPGQLNFGPIAGDRYMVGGDWRYTDFGNGPQDLAPEISRQGLFTYVSYDVTDDVEVFAQFSRGRAETSMDSTPQFNFGGITIQRDNAFLPQEVVDRMVELDLTSLTVGSWNADYGGILTETTREQNRYLVGLSGRSLQLFGSDWSWDVYANRNVSHYYNSTFPTITARYREAIDAVRAPSGAIVCRSTLTAPNNGCVPYNLLGTGTASEAAIDYVGGHAWLSAELTQDVFAANLNGEPFESWAGPVSLAMGIEHRREKITGDTDPLSPTNSYWAGNYKPMTGSYHVSEAYAETIVPLVEDLLDVNLAVRATDYSSSGYVTTWKAGLNFSPVDDIRFRFTKSRDIRAGTLNELYASGQTQTSSIDDPFRDYESTTYFQVTSGNPDLKPEKADTFSAGIVYRPSFLPGLSGSVDYFDISVKDAVTTLGFGTILTECFLGDQTLCAQTERDASGVLTQIRRAPLNFARQDVRGMDLELAYRTDLWGNDFSIRGMASHYLKAELDNGIDAPMSSLGENRDGIPDWRYRVQATYDTGLVALSAVGRGVSDGVYGTTYIECTQNCPESTAEHPTINNNHIDGAFYLDLSARVKPWDGIEFMFVVTNVANRAPSIAARGTSVGSGPIDVFGYYYDLIGRMYRAGVRFEF